MATPGSSSLITVFVVSVTVMSFFTTTAAERIEKMEDPNYRMVGTLTLVSSYCLLLLLGFLVISRTAVLENEAMFAGMKVVFAAFIPLAFFLLIEHMGVLEEAWSDPDFNIIKTLGGCIAIGLLYLMILFIQP